MTSTYSDDPVLEELKRLRIDVASIINKPIIVSRLSRPTNSNTSVIEECKKAPIKVYHIILDCNYCDKNNLFSDSVMFGKVRDSHTDDNYISVLFNFDHARQVANKMVQQTVIMGTIGNKQHPVFGAIIACFSMFII